jgi:DAACS family dicarboxylate/amino acid:cation (Na+ or H+) symporter
MNMNGTALFEGVTVLFLAQVFGVELTLVQQALVVLLAVLMAIGTAGIPGGSIPMIMIVLATVNLRPDAIAIILGVDRVLDMGRTVLNVTGDMVTATFVSRLDHGPGPAPLNGAEG